MEEKHLHFVQQWLEKRNESWLGGTVQFPQNKEVETKGSTNAEQARWKRVQQEQDKRGVTPLRSEAHIIALHQEEQDASAYVEQKNVYEQSSHTYEETCQEWLSFHFNPSQSDWKVSSMLVQTTPDIKSSSRILHIPDPIAKDIASGQYQPARAVAYAEQYWNTYNPHYRFFYTNDCTNFVSQCLAAGGFPMVGKRRDQGWWYRHGRTNKNDSWSYSWVVAHALYHYLDGLSQDGKKVRRVSSAYELQLGDVICYDFEGDGRWNHNTIVTMKDGEGAPLVNAHTNNSQHRYWTYTDSHAYTDNIKYAFFHIVR